MYKYLFVFLLFLTANNIYGQRNLKTLDGSAKRSNTSRNVGTDSLYDRGTKKIAKNTKAKIEDYKIISRKGDTTHVDTTLTIQKEYKFNYLRRDYFELLPFNNMGQTYNTLSHNMSSQNMLPRFGTKGKHYNYMSVNDISYYHVPTPLTELMFKSNFEQGQLLDAFLLPILQNNLIFL